MQHRYGVFEDHFLGRRGCIVLGSDPKGMELPGPPPGPPRPDYLEVDRLALQCFVLGRPCIMPAAGISRATRTPP
jgi:hypothetical protein